MVIRQLLFIGKRQETYLFRRIKAEASNYSFEVFATTYDKVEISIDEIISLSLQNIPFIQPSAVFLDYPGNFSAIQNFLVNYLTKQGIFILNNRSLQQWPILNKLTQTYELQRANIPFVPSQIGGSVSILNNLVEKEDKSLILKFIAGASGTSVYKVDSSKDLLEVLRFHKPQELLVQKMMNPSQEYRVIVIGNKVLGAVKKIPSIGEFRANWSQGATLQPVVVSHVIEELAVRSASALQCDFAGVDILCVGTTRDETECRVLEVNRYCGFEGFEQATGINVASSLLKWTLAQL